LPTSIRSTTAQTFRPVTKEYCADRPARTLAA